MKKFSLNLEVTEEKNVILTLQMPRIRFFILLSFIATLCVTQFEVVAQYAPIVRDVLLRYAKIFGSFFGG
jgi:hypothetical protein